MSFRIEKKIAIYKNNISNFRNYILEDKFVVVYPDREVFSIYFDTESYQMFRDSVEGIVPRKKIRIRKYNDLKNDEFFFEIKISSVEGRYKTVKKINDSKKILDFGYFDQNYGLCYPKIIVKYNRSYYKKKNVRITLDKNISFSKYQKHNITSFNAYSDYDCAEIKCKKIDDLENFDLDQIQIIRNSKYCIGINELFKNSNMYTEPF